MSERDLSVDVCIEIKERNGRVLRDNQDPEEIDFCPACMEKAKAAIGGGDPITIRTTIVNLLDAVATGPNKQPLDGMEKKRRADLADKIYAADGPLELSKSDRDMIKQLIGENCSPLVVGQIFPVIDPAGNVKE